MVRLPIAVASPGIERAVVARLTNRLKHVIELDNVPAPTSIVDADSRAGSMEDCVMTHHHLFGGRDIHASRLLTEHAQLVHEIIVDSTIGGIIR